MRTAIASLGVSVRIAVASSTALSTVGTAVTSLVALPLLQVVFLTAIAATLGSPELVLTAYAGVLMTLGSTVALGIVGQVTRDRMSDVLTEILLNRPLSWTYWAGKTITPLATGILVAGAAALAVFAVDPSHSITPLLATLGFTPVVAVGGVMIGVAVALASILQRDPYFLANGLAAVLPLTSGVVAPLAAYPPVMDVLARLFPFANAIDAFRTAVAGDFDPWLVALECAVCTGWFACGVAFASMVARRLRDGVSIKLAW